MKEGGRSLAWIGRSLPEGWLVWHGAVIKRSLMVLVAVLSLSLVAFAALPQPPVTLKVLMTAPDAIPWTRYVQQFERENPDIRLQIVEGPNNVDQVEGQYTTAFLLGNSPYDLVNMDIIWVPKFAAAGWLRDLSDDFSPQDLSVFVPSAIQGGRYRDRLYRLPIRGDAGMLYYRKDLLAAQGLQPPQTLEELVQTAKTLQANQAVQWGYVWPGKQYEGISAMFVELLHGFGGEWINPDTLEVGLDQPAALQAVEFLRETIRQGVSPPGVTTYVEEDLRQLFQNGKAAFMRNWPYAWALLNADNSPVKGKVGIMPMVPSASAPAGTTGGACLGGWGLGIAKTSAHPKEALRAMKFLTGVAAQKQIIMDVGYVPTRTAMFTDPEIMARYGHYPQLATVVDQAVLRPPIAQYAQASDILQRYLSAAITNQQSTQQAMQAAAAETRRLVEAGRTTQDR
jgi:multiple sugar transport system substrate-binding protein